MVNTGVQVSINTLLSFLPRVYTYNDRPTFVQNHLATVQPGRKEPSNPDTRPCTMIFDTNTSSQHREPTSCIPALEPHLIPAVHHVSFSNSLFIPLSYFRSLHCYPTPNLFRPFFSPVKRRPQTKLLPTTFQLSTYSILECWTFLDDRRVVLRSRESGSHTTRNVRAARREYTIEWKIFVRQIIFNTEIILKIQDNDQFIRGLNRSSQFN